MDAGPVTPCGIPNIATIAVTKTAGFDTTKDTVALDLSALYTGCNSIYANNSSCHGSANGTGALPTNDSPI
jgi:hypothetical protein